MFISCLISCFVFVNNVEAIEYRKVRKSDFQYEINNFYISGDYLIINGWGKIVGNSQHYLNDSTHSYSILLRNINNSASALEYYATLLPTDKTNYFKRVSTNRVCAPNLTYQDEDYCYMNVKNIAFEFKIPLSDLGSDVNYNVSLRIHAKTINVGYQTEMFAPAIRDYQERNGIRYELSSDYSTTKIYVMSDMLFVKAGPGLETARQTSWQYCSLTGYTLYWREWHPFTSLQEVAKTSSSYDAETWFRVLFDQGLCEGGRSRAFMGWSYSGWMPSSYTDFDGTPAMIKITTQNYASIDQIKTYTAPKGEQTKIKIGLYNKTNQSNNIKVYNDGKLIYNQNLSYSGSKELEVKFNIEKKGEVEVVITEPSGYQTKLKSPIYVSSFETHEVKEKEININPETPIIVITDKLGSRNIYEKLKITIPYSSIKLVSGKSIQTWSFIEYSTTNNELNINQDVNSKVLFPTQEKTLMYPFENNKIKVKMEKVDSNSSQMLLNLPEYVLDKNKGFVYQKGNEPKNIKTINGDRKWYVPISDNIGKYDYQINLSNVGVNKVSVKFNCNYEIIKKLIGDINSLYIIKRVDVPQNLIIRFSNIYSYNDLIKVGGY